MIGLRMPFPRTSSRSDFPFRACHLVYTFFCVVHASHATAHAHVSHVAAATAAVHQHCGRVYSSCETSPTVPATKSAGIPHCVFRQPPSLPVSEPPPCRVMHSCSPCMPPATESAGEWAASMQSHVKFLTVFSALSIRPSSSFPCVCPPHASILSSTPASPLLVPRHRWSP